MDYILNKMEDSLKLNELLNDKFNLLKYHQARAEYILVLLLSYLWNKNLKQDKLSPDDIFKIYSSISNRNFTIGTLIRVIELLDVESEVITDASVKKTFEHYRNTRNEEIGHGFIFSDASDKLILEFENLYTDFSKLSTKIIKNEFEIILILQIDNNLYKGISCKSNGTFSIWKCSIKNYNFNINEIYAQITENGVLNYYRLSPFVGFEMKGGTNIDYFIFSKINNPLTGGATYNFLSKSGRKSDLEWSELINTGVVLDGNLKVSKNNTTANDFIPNYKNFIDIGIIKEEIKKFLINNKAQISANLWGHGGVGKTATIQKIIDEFLKSEKKHFKYILFLSAKNTIFNTETGKAESIEADNIIGDFETLIGSIYSILIRDTETNVNQQELQIKKYSEGKTFIVIDDYESFNSLDKEKIIKFVNSLNLDFFKVIITTRSSAEITGSLAIPINELDANKTRMFLMELVKNDKNILNKDEIEKSLKISQNIKKLHLITDGRPLFIEYFKNILTRVDFHDAIQADIKSSKEAIGFLYGKIYDYLSSIAKNIFISIGQMNLGDDLSLLIEHTKFISDNDNENIEAFKNAINELEEYKIIKIDESSKYIKLWAIEVLEPMKTAFNSSKNLDLKSLINQRVKLVIENKSAESIPEVYFQEAEKMRLDGNKTVTQIEAAYRRILKIKESSKSLKLDTLYKLGTYLISQGYRDKAIKTYDTYEKLFRDNSIFIKRFSYLCYGSKNKNHRDKSIQILLDYINNKKHRNEISLSTKLEIYAIVVMRKNTFFTDEIDEIRNVQLIGRVTKLEYTKSYKEYIAKLKQITQREGSYLFNQIRKYDLKKLSKGEKHYIYNGLYHYVDICLKTKMYKIASEICEFSIKNTPENYHKQFNNYLRRIPDEKIIIKNNIKPKPRPKPKAKTKLILKDDDIVTCKITEITEKIISVLIIKTKQKGTLFINEISSKFVESPSKIFYIGQEIDLIVKGKDPNDFISLSLKKMENKVLHVGQIVKGKVIQIREKSVNILIIGKSLIGEIFIKYIAYEYINDINEHLKIDDEIYAEVISISAYGIVLSLLDVEQNK